MIEISKERLAELEKYEAELKARKQQTIEEKLAKIDTSTVGGKMKYFRKLRGMNQLELAEKMGTSRHTVVNTENSVFIPKFQTILKISDALNVCVEDIDPWAIPAYDLRRQRKQEANKCADAHKSAK